MAGGYAKVFASLWQGTLGVQWEAWSVFVYMLANCDAQGRFDQTPEIIATRSGLPLETVEKGLRVLEQPDRRSRRAIENGRRILRLDEHRDWGWGIVNYGFYRGSMDEDERREKDRVRQRKHRLIVAAQSTSRDVTNGHALSRQAEAEAEAEAEELDLGISESKCMSEAKPLVNGAEKPAPIDRVGGEAARDKTRQKNLWRETFAETFWPSYPRKVARIAAENEWMKLANKSSDEEYRDLIDAIIEGLDWYKRNEWSERPKDKITHASTWLHQRRWEDVSGLRVSET